MKRKKCFVLIPIEVEVDEESNVGVVVHPTIAEAQRAFHQCEFKNKDKALEFLRDALRHIPRG